MTSSIVIYYSMAGNTRAIAEEFQQFGYEVINIKEIEKINMSNYSTIIFGTSTWGRGLPPKPFFKIRDQLVKLHGKRIGLFGSGRSEYEYYCGALDLLEELMRERNEIVFKYKYEAYPREIDRENIRGIIQEEMK